MCIRFRGSGYYHSQRLPLAFGRVSGPPVANLIHVNQNHTMSTIKNTINFVKAFTCTVPVWVDGKKTEDTEERVKALFVSRLAGIARGTYGSCFMDRDATVETVEQDWSTEADYSEYLRMDAVEGSDFAKVVVK